MSHFSLFGERKMIPASLCPTTFQSNRKNTSHTKPSILTGCWDVPAQYILPGLRPMNMDSVTIQGGEFQGLDFLLGSHPVFYLLFQSESFLKITWMLLGPQALVSESPHALAWIGGHWSHQGDVPKWYVQFMKLLNKHPILIDVHYCLLMLFL